MVQVFWSESGDLLVIACEGNFYVLRYNREIVDSNLANASEEEGLEEAFEVLSEHQETYALFLVLKKKKSIDPTALCVCKTACERAAGLAIASSTPTHQAASTITSVGRSTPSLSLTSILF